MYLLLRERQQQRPQKIDDSKIVASLLRILITIVVISTVNVMTTTHAYALTHMYSNLILTADGKSSQKCRRIPLVVQNIFSSTGSNFDYHHHHHHHHHHHRSRCQRIVVQRLPSTTIEEDLPVSLPPSTASTSTKSSYTLQSGQPTELPDSLSDAAIRAAEATKYYYDLVTNEGSITSIPVRGRIDFDTTLGDETYTILKQSTPFVQQYITALTYAFIPQSLQQRQNEMMAVIQAKNELQQLKQQSSTSVPLSTTLTTEDIELLQQQREQREDELIELIANNGRNVTSSSQTIGSEKSKKPVIRIYFPDEGSAALARRDWTSSIVPCLDYVEFRSCNGIQPSSISSSVEVIAQIFICPRASDSDAVERILESSENDVIMTTTTPPQPQEQQQPRQSSLVSIFINPLLVDMGVTGFGYAGRRLRERLLDTLVGIYYLRTLPNGAMTRQYPSSYTIWQEDSNAIGGYICIANCQNRLPSNPEVIDIFDNYVNGGEYNPDKSNGGFLDQLGDFVNGMMRL